MPGVYRYRRPIIIIPPTTDRTIVFPYNALTKKFLTQHYFPGMTNNQVSTEEINQFLAEVENMVAPCHQAAGQRVMRWMTFGILLAAIAFGAAIPLSIITSNSRNQAPPAPGTPPTVSSSFPIGIPIAFGIFFGYLILFVIMSCIYSRRGAAKIREVAENVKAYIGQRSSQYQGRGLNWVVPLNFPHWIELWIDPSVNRPPVNMFGAMQFPQMDMSMTHGDVSSDTILHSHYNDSPSMNTIQPMRMQIQPQQQGIYMQNPYGMNIYNKQGVYA